MTAPLALTIAGSDSSGAAGVQADLPTFAALGADGRAAITVVTAQSSAGVAAFHAVPADVVARQLDTVFDDAEPIATKTGMLGRAEVLDVIAARTSRLGRLVVDPVLTDSSGSLMFGPDVIDRYRELIGRALVCTPNRWEIEHLVGHPCAAEDLIAMAGDIRSLGATHVVVTGGRVDDPSATQVVDVVVSPDGVWVLDAPRRDGPGSIRGTGCTFSAAITAALARGAPAEDAIRSAHRFVQTQLALLGPAVTLPGRRGLPHWTPQRN